MSLVRFALWLTFTVLLTKLWMPGEASLMQKAFTISGSGIAAAFLIGMIAFIVTIPLMVFSPTQEDGHGNSILANIYLNIALPLALLGVAYALYTSALEQENTSINNTSKFADGVVRCEEPLPEFSLGQYSHPSDAQVSTLCSCIWSSLPETAQKFSRQIQDELQDEPSDLAVTAFTSLFHKAMSNCGGFSL